MGTLGSGTISPRLRRIAKLASESPQRVLTTLSHHIDVGFLEEAYRLTRKNGAVGVDGVTAEAYSVNLQENLRALLERFKSGAYRAPPVRRVYIPKSDGLKTRPIGIPAFEDKILQRAVTMVLEAVYEEGFLDCSYGFRPGRSAHQALEALWTGLTKMGGRWVLDVDIKAYFDTIDPRHLRSFLDHRVRDGVIRRAIGKWLNAGVMEDGQVRHPNLGTPQGGVISPLLANIYLHEVLDKWFAQEVQPRLIGQAFMVRYADDFVIAFEYECDARRALDALPKRLERFGLTMHPEKTKLVDFRRPVSPTCDDRRRDTFDLLGFTHFWGQSRKRKWTVKRKTAKGRIKRVLKRCSDWCRRNRHMSVKQQHEKLSQSLKGHDAYYGITDNGPALSHVRHHVKRIWRTWLDRRTGKARMTWEKFHRLLKKYPLPPGRVVHSVYQRQQLLPIRV